MAVDSSDEVGESHGEQPAYQPSESSTTALMYLVVSDGRTSESKGLSLKQLADFMKELNVTTAYNLDGGGSSIDVL